MSRVNKTQRNNSYNPKTQKPYSKTQWRHLSQYQKQQNVQRNLAYMAYGARARNNLRKKKVGTASKNRARVSPSVPIIPCYIGQDGSILTSGDFWQATMPSMIPAPRSKTHITDLFGVDQDVREFSQCDHFSFNEAIRTTSHGRMFGATDIIQRLKLSDMRPGTHFQIVGFTANKAFKITVNGQVHLTSGIAMGAFPVGTMVGAPKGLDVKVHLLLLHDWSHSINCFGPPGSAFLPFIALAKKCNISVTSTEFIFQQGRGALRVIIPFDGNKKGNRPVYAVQQTSTISNFQKDSNLDANALGFEHKEMDIAPKGVVYLNLISKNKEKLAKVVDKRVKLSSGYGTMFHLETPLRLTFTHYKSKKPVDPKEIVLTCQWEIL
jgi:hypothetical protein